jgi:hypothetical protein
MRHADLHNMQEAEKESLLVDMTFSPAVREPLNSVT